MPPASFSGDDFLDDSVYFESGPYGSNNDGTWFTDFRQKLDGSRSGKAENPRELELQFSLLNLPMAGPH